LGISRLIKKNKNNYTINKMSRTSKNNNHNYQGPQVDQRYQGPQGPQEVPIQKTEGSLLDNFYSMDKSIVLYIIAFIVAGCSIYYLYRYISMVRLEVLKNNEEMTNKVENLQSEITTLLFPLVHKEVECDEGVCFPIEEPRKDHQRGQKDQKDQKVQKDQNIQKDPKGDLKDSKDQKGDSKDHQNDRQNAPSTQKALNAIDDIKKFEKKIEKKIEELENFGIDDDDTDSIII
jgi:hypothetical protein